MSKIIGVTVGTPTSPAAMLKKLNPVTSVNGITPNDDGNVEISVQGSSGDIDLSGYATLDDINGMAYLDTEDNAEVEVLESTGSLGGSVTKPTFILLDSIEFEEETQNRKVEFPEGYTEYLLIGKLTSPSTSSTLVLYPIAVVDRNGTTGNDYFCAFMDFYPGTNPSTFEVLFQTATLGEAPSGKITYFHDTRANGSRGNMGTSGWKTTSTNGFPFIRPAAVDVSRLIGAGSTIKLYGRK